MTTLLAVYDHSGCIGRCDASCYNAQHDRCTCICGGRNHQKGLRQATENVKELVESLTSQYDKVECVSAYQLSLFEMESENV